MSAQILQQILTSTGAVSLSRDALGSTFADILTLHYKNGPLVIAHAVVAAADDGAVTVSGVSSFANVADLPVTARFSVDAAGALHAELRYRLRDAAPGPAAWTFSRSFPDLPESWDAASQSATRLLDQLDLFDTWFVVSTHEGVDATFGVPLRPGLNFVSHLRPGGLLGAFESAAKSSPTLTMYGVIYPGRLGDLVLELLPDEHPWDRLDRPTTGALPAGIYLAAKLDLGFSAGELALRDTALRIYSPISSAFTDQNPSFSVTQGFTGRLSIPSAGVEVNLGADVQRGVAQALLYANLTGVSVGKLANLLDIAGTDGLHAQIPEALQRPVEALEALELERVALDIVLRNGLPIVRAAFVTVGFPNLKWKVWNDDLVVESLACRFTIFDPFRINPVIEGVPPLFRSRVNVCVTGVLQIEGAALSVSAYNHNGFEVRARTLDEVSLPLDKLLASRGPGITSPSPLTISALDILIAPGKKYSMDLALSASPKPWTIDFGKQQLAVSDVALQLEKLASGSVTGRFSGTIDFEGFVLQVDYNLPGSLVIRSVLPRIQLARLIEKLCSQSVKLPSGFDLTLSSSSIVIQVQQGKPAFQLMTDVKGLGVLAFEARSLGGADWGFAYGLDLSAGQPSKVPGLAQIAALEKMLHLQRFLLVVSSVDQPGFQLPDSAQFNTPQLATKKVALRGGGGVSAGLNIFADWSLDSSDKKQGLLKQLLGLNGNVEVTIAVPMDLTNGTRLFVERTGSIQGRPFDYKLGVLMDHGQPAFFLTGNLTVPIQKSPVTFDVTTLFVASGAFMSATMKNPKPIDLGPFKLSNVAVEIGVNWGGVPSLGLTASIDVKDFSSSVAVFFDSTNPANSLVAGSISNVNAKQVLSALVPGVSTPIDKVLEGIAIKGTHAFSLPGDLTDELDGIQCEQVAAAFAAAKVTVPASSQQLAISPKKKGSSWHITDLTKMRHYQLEKKGDAIQAQIAPQFYFAPQATSIGTIKFPQAYYLSAAISFAGFDAEATIDVANNKGFSIEAAMDPIVIADAKLFAITALKGEGGPQISISTLSQPDNPVPQFRQPHVYINGALSMFGLKQGIYANVTAEGVDFELVGDLVPGVHFDVDARFGKSGLGASGQLTIGVGTIDLGSLGKAKINTKLDVAITIDIDHDTKPAAKPAVAATLKEASLALGGSFGQGKTLLDNGLITLVFQADGNLVLYKKDGAPIWSSDTQGKGGARVDLQADGNLVIYSASNKPVWATGTNGKGVTSLVAQTDGNLVLYDGSHKPKWDTNTDGRVSPADFDDGDDGSAHFSDASLSLGASFGQGSTLLDNGLAKLVFQGDGNLCLYNKQSGGYLWGTNTAGKGAKRVELQTDGNFVVYDGANKALWASGTAGKGASVLVLQTDGNLVMYDGGHAAKWSSNTGGKCDPTDGSGITLEASFTFAGQRIDLGKFHVEVTADTFTRLPKLLEKKVEKALRGEFKDMTKWANAVSGGVMDGVNDTAKVFKDVYGKSEKEAKELASDVSKGLKSTEKALSGAEKTVEKGAKKVIKKMKFW